MDNNFVYSSRERVLNLIKNGKADRVPKGELVINDPLIQTELKCDSVNFAQRLAFVNSLGLDIITLSPTYPKVARELPRPQEYLWPDLEKWTKETSLFSFAILDGAFEWGMRLFGFEEYFILLKKSPDSLLEFIKEVEKLNTLMIEKLVGQGINGIILADDIAYQRGFLINPKTIRKYFMPSIERQVKEIDKAGVPAFYHSDGNYREVIGDIINAGFVGLHCLERNSGMLVDELQQEIGDKLCLWGHLDVNDLENSKEPACREELVKSINKLGKNNKFILGTNSGLFEAMDIESLKTLYSAVS